MSWTVPKTWNVGDVLTSPDLNTYVRDNTSYLYGDLGWTALTLTSGWSSFAGYFAPAYRLAGTRLFFRGNVNNASLAATVAARNNFATLPAGLAPAARMSVPTLVSVGGGNPTVSYIDIQGTTMGIYSYVTGTGLLLRLDGFNFDTLP